MYSKEGFPSDAYEYLQNARDIYNKHGVVVKEIEETIELLTKSN